MRYSALFFLYIIPFILITIQITAEQTTTVQNIEFGGRRSERTFEKNDELYQKSGVLKYINYYDKDKNLKKTDILFDTGIRDDGLHKQSSIFKSDKNKEITSFFEKNPDNKTKVIQYYKNDLLVREETFYIVKKSVNGIEREIEYYNSSDGKTTTIEYYFTEKYRSEKGIEKTVQKYRNDETRDRIIIIFTPEKREQSRYDSLIKYFDVSGEKVLKVEYIKNEKVIQVDRM